MIDLINILNETGDSFCKFAMSMLIQSGILIVLLYIVDLLIRKYVRAVFRYCIWMLIFVKLVLPVSLSSPVSMGQLFGDNLAASKTEIPIMVESDNINRRVMIEAPAGTAENKLASSESPREFAQIQPNPAQKADSVIPEPITITWQAVVFLAWLVGVLVLSVLLFQRFLFVKGLLAQSDIAHGRLEETLQQCSQQVGLRRNIEFRLSKNMLSPAACGLLRPVILMPALLLENLSREKLRAVLIHELAHIKRGDLWVNFIQTILQIIYFYNPLLWFANAVVRGLREKAVDEMVITKLGAEADSYSSTLIDIAEIAFSRPHFSLRLVGVVESKKALADRIKHILSRPFPKTARLGIAGMITIIISAAVLLPMAKGASRQPEFIGHWKGQAKIIVSWIKQKNLPIDIEINTDGTIEGTIGDANLINGKLVKKSWVYTKIFQHENPYWIKGDLQGNIINSENIQRDSVTISIRVEDGKIDGGLGTSGTKTGGKDNMILSAIDVSLKRIDSNSDPKAVAIIDEVQKAYDALETYSSTCEVAADYGNTLIFDAENFPSLDPDEIKILEQNLDFKNIYNTSYVTNTSLTMKLARPKLYCMQWVMTYIKGRGSNYTGDQFGAVWSDGKDSYGIQYNKQIRYDNFYLGSGPWGSSETVPTIFYDRYNNTLKELKELVKEEDDVFEGQPCYVISGLQYDKPVKFWISKERLLILKKRSEINFDGKTDVLQCNQTEKVLDAMGKEVTPEAIKIMEERIENGFAKRDIVTGVVIEIQRDIVINDPISNEQLIPSLTINDDNDAATLPNGMENVDSHNLLIERRDILQEKLHTLEQKSKAGMVDSKELQQAKIDLLRVDSELAQIPQQRIEILGQIVNLYVEQEKRTQLLLDAGRASLGELDEIKLLSLDAETELARAKAEANNQQTDFKVTLPNGVTVELVGVCEYPSQGKQWWKPDGSLLSSLPKEIINGRHDLSYNGSITDFMSYYNFLLEVKGNSVLDCGAEGAFSRVELGDGTFSDNFGILTEDFSKSEISAGVTIYIPAGQWNTLLDTSNGKKEISEMELGTYRSVSLGDAFEEGGKTHLPATYVRVLGETTNFITVDAVDKNGKSHKAERCYYPPDRQEKSWSNSYESKPIYMFDLSPKMISHYEVKSRPILDVTFKNVSLKPNLKTDVQIDIEPLAKTADNTPNDSFQSDVFPAVMESYNAQMAKPDKQQGDFSLKLANGTTVELVGLCSGLDAKERIWWHPNGLKADSDEFQIYNQDVKPKILQDQFRYAYIFKVSPQDNATVDSDVSVGICWHRNHISDKLAEIGYVYSGSSNLNVNDFPVEGVIKIAVAVGNYEQFESKLYEGTASDTGVLYDRTTSLTISGPRDYPGFSEKFIDVTLTSNEYDVMVIYELTDGTIKDTIWDASTGGPFVTSFIGKQNPLIQYSFRVPDPWKQIKKFIVKYRKYQLAAFKNVSLKPNLKTDVQIDVGALEDVIGQGWEIAWRGKNLDKSSGPRCSIYVRSINEVAEGVELNIAAVFSKQKDIPQQFRPIAIDSNGKMQLCNSKVTAEKNDEYKTYTFYALFKNLKLKDVNEFQLQFKYSEKKSMFENKHSVEPNEWTTKWQGKQPEIADMVDGSVLVGNPKEKNGQLEIPINDTFYDGTESRIIVVDNKDKIHTGKQTSEIVPEKVHRTTKVTFADISLKDVKEFQFQIKPQGVTIDLSAKWNEFDSSETVQLHATVASESNKELIITEGEYGFRLIVDGNEYLWNPKTREADYPYMRMNKGDVRTVLITIDRDEWRSAKDDRKFLELNSSRHSIQAIAIPHPSSNFKERIYSNLIGFKIENAKTAAPIEVENITAMNANKDFTATLPNGVAVELVGVCEYPSQGKQWWKPDGGLLTTAPEYNNDGKIYLNKDEKAYEMVLKTIGENIIDAGAAWDIPNTSSSTGNEIKDGMMTSQITFRGKDLGATIDFKVGIAYGKYNTVSTLEANSTGLHSYDNIFWFEPSEKNGKTLVNISADIVNENTKIVAIGKNGKIVNANTASSSTENTSGIQASFNIPLAEIKEFQFQTRPYEWVTFKNVSLKPNAKTDVEINKKTNLEKLANELKDYAEKNENRFPVNLENIEEKMPIEIYNWAKDNIIYVGNGIWKNKWGYGAIAYEKKVSLSNGTNGGYFIFNNGMILFQDERQAVELLMEVKSRTEEVKWEGPDLPEHIKAWPKTNENACERMTNQALRAATVAGGILVNASYVEQWPNSPEMTKMLNRIGLEYNRVGRVDDAVNTLQKAIKLANKTNDPFGVILQENLVSILKEQPNVKTGTQVEVEKPLEEKTWVVQAERKNSLPESEQKYITIQAKVFSIKSNADDARDFLVNNLKLSNIPMDKPLMMPVELTDNEAENFANYISSQPDVSLLVSPKVRAIDGEKADMQVTNRDKYVAGYENGKALTKEYETGVELEFMPKLQQDNSNIILKIDFKKTDIAKLETKVDESGNEIEMPFLDTKSISTTLLVPLGKSMLIPVAGLSRIQSPLVDTKMISQTILLIKADVQIEVKKTLDPNTVDVNSLVFRREKVKADEETSGITPVR